MTREVLPIILIDPQNVLAKFGGTTLHSPQPPITPEAPVIPGALEGWQHIEEAGFMPRICTGRDHRTEMRAWLEQNLVPTLGPLVITRAVFTPYHNVAIGAGYIEAGVRPIPGSTRPGWERIVFGDFAGMTGRVNALRIKAWDDPALPDILHEAHDRFRKRAPSSLVVPRKKLVR